MKIFGFAHPVHPGVPFDRARREGLTIRFTQKSAESAAMTAAVNDATMPQATSVEATTRKKAVKPDRPTTKPRARRVSAPGP